MVRSTPWPLASTPPLNGTPSLTLARPSSSMRPESGSRRLMELELMHRWTVKSWQGFCAVPEERDFLRDDLPRLAMKHEFLLEGLFAVASLDIAGTDSSHRGPYLRVGLESYYRSSAMFRQQLANMTPEDCHLFFSYAVFTVAVHALMSQHGFGGKDSEPVSALETIKTMFNLSRGAHMISSTFLEAFSEQKPYVETLRGTLQVRPVFLRDEEAEAILLLHAVNDHVNSPELEVNSTPGASTWRSTHAMYDNAIQLLQVYYAHDYEGNVKGMWLSAATHMGGDFAAAMERSEPMAMLLLMHWGVLLERSSPHFWWAKSVGKTLVEQLSTLVQASVLASLPNVLQHVNWVKRQVDQELPSMAVA